jgi:hypothetical protein
LTASLNNLSSFGTGGSVDLVGLLSFESVETVDDVESSKDPEIELSDLVELDRFPVDNEGAFKP